jgi:hypothetical protein
MYKKKTNLGEEITEVKLENENEFTNICNEKHRGRVKGWRSESRESSR